MPSKDSEHTMNLGNLKISTRLAGMVGLCIAFMVVLSVTALYEMGKMRDAAAALATAEELGAYYSSARNMQITTLVVALAVSAAAVTWMMRSITGPLQLAVAAADRVAQGDLTGTIESSSTDELGQLLQALRRMQNNLVVTVSTVCGNTDSVATASAEIAQGNQDLSTRTEEQAGALQQATATMTQLSATVRNNAENAKQASTLALGASTVATRGGEVVGQVVGTMKGINEGSRKIASIISVIDGIAFQTNILALNAAVEAARAGEQGRGFAVVAGEVRSLAQRSAEAAKEIKVLITNSVEQVESGTALVDQAGQTMDEIVGSIRRVSDIVAEISAASAEQSTGIAQVGQAVSQMDQVTQQNAALVEQSAAAADSLKQQAQELARAMTAFKINRAVTAAAPAPVRPAARTTAARRPAAKPSNVVRPAFRAKPAPSEPAANEPAAPRVVAASTAVTGTDDWESF
jgi:methyl-accepting chemotaxis protein